MAPGTQRRTELLRGVLDFCLLAVMGEGPAYGYEMTRRLRDRGLAIVGEGSIYPLLGRLERDGLVDTFRAASNGGPPRKYYRLSRTGRQALALGVSEWRAARDAVDAVLAPVTTRGGVMTDFVEQCREEWRRLGVPDPLAEEMAGDLLRDLREAEAEGIPLRSTSCSSAFDPPIVRRRVGSRTRNHPGIAHSAQRTLRRPFFLAVFTALAALMLIVAALLLLTGEPKVSLVRSRRPFPRRTRSSRCGPVRMDPRTCPPLSSSTRAPPHRSSGSCSCSRSWRSPSPRGCGRGGNAHGRPASLPRRRLGAPRRASGWRAGTTSSRPGCAYLRRRRRTCPRRGFEGRRASASTRRRAASDGSPRRPSAAPAAGW